MSRKFSPALLLLSILLLWALIRQFVSAMSWGHGSYQMTECLINYAGGFVRRGLLGEIVWHLADWTGIQANHIVIVATYGFYFCLLTWFLRKATKAFAASLILSCIAMGFPAFQDSIVRKDCLGLLFLIACLKANGLPRIQRVLAVNLMAGTAILIHEGFAFYTLPALVFFVAKENEDLSVSKMVHRCLELVPAAICFGFTTIFHGTPEIAQAVNRSWIPLWQTISPTNAGLNDPSAAILALGWSAGEGLGPGLNLLTSGIYQPLMWASLFGISFVLIVLFTGKKNDQIPLPAIAEKPQVVSVLLMQLVFVSPLFILGHDYGRWLFFWAASSIIIHTVGLRSPRWVESTVSRWFEKLRLTDIFRRLPAKDWYFLFVGIPVCWNLAAFLIASPIALPLREFASWF